MRLPLLLPLMFLVAACNDDSTPPEPETASTSIPFRVDGTLSFVRGTDTLRTIDIEVADTDSSRGRGMMERRDIPPDTGMLFIFPRAEPQAFYMMNTPRSLDIQYYGPDSTLLNIAENTVPYSIENVYSDGPAQFVVEVPAGYSRRLGLVEGDRITWTLGDGAASGSAVGDSLVTP